MTQIKSILIGFGVLLLSLVVAQNAPYVLKTYDLTQLDARPGGIIISPDVLTLLEFDDQVLDVSTARPDAMTIELSGNIIRIRSNWREGSTDLVVTVANRTALFMISIEPEGEHSRRYVIERPQIPNPTSSTNINTSQAKAGKALEPNTSLPQWLSVSFNVLSVSGEETVIQYGIRNTGQHDIISDAFRLNIIQEGYKTPFKLERVSTGGTSNRIKPNFAEYGIILISDSLPGELSLVWDLVEVGPGNTHTVKEIFNEGLLQQVR